MSKVFSILALGMMSFASLCFSANTQESETMTKQEQTVQKPMVLLKTSMGDIKIELNSEKAPISVKNFLQYVKDGHYDHTIFHRVIDGFMVQGGGFTKDMNQKTSRAPIQIESDNGLKNVKGSVAMARTSDPNSASAQFFINVSDNSFLDFKAKNSREYGYAVFGKVVEGMNVVEQIKKVKTSSKGPHENVPVVPVEIIEAKVVE